VSKPSAEGRRLLVVAPRGVLTHVGGVFFALQEQGVDLVFAAKTERIDRVRLPEDLAAGGGVSVVPLPLRRKGAGADAVGTIRLLADYARFLDPTLAGADYPRTRIARRLRTVGLGTPGGSAPSLTPNGSAWLRETLRTIEGSIAPPRELEDAVAALEPDAMLLVTRCSFGGAEPDAIKTARKLDIPSVMLVWSWDNLSSKAVLQEHPDRVLVWNETQRTEAVELHGIEPERIRVVGAPNFDRFFEEVAGIGRRLREEGQPATVLYLGSSPNIAADEPAIFDHWLEAVRSADDRPLRDAAVVVRPHPASVDRWRAWKAPRGVVVDEPRAKVDQPALARLLARADVAVALNTSAEIEAAIAGCPVVTFRAGQEAPGQEGSVHFSYLLSGSGGFVEDSPSLDTHATRLAAVLRGEYDRTGTERFVESFVRPLGVDRPVSPIVASAILELVSAADPVVA
jgi:hypothetical protein